MVNAGKALMTIAGIVIPISVGLILAGPWPTIFGIEVILWLLGFGLFAGAAGFVFYVFGQPSPLITLDGPNAFHVGRVMMYFPESRIRAPFPADALFMRLVNQPRYQSSRSKKALVSARFRVEGPGTDHLPSLDARWSDTPQPRPGELGQLTRDLEVDSRRQIVLVLKEPSRTGCYLFNNDSYNFAHQRGQRPEWRMAPGLYTARVRVSGEGVKKHFACQFENPGEGEALRVARFWEE